MPDFAFSRHRPVGFAELVWEVFFTQRGRGVNLPSHFPWLVQPRQSGLWFASLHESGTLLAGLAVRRLPGAPSMAAIGLVCVRPELRGQGVARQLLSSALIETDRLGLSALTLWTAKPEVYAGHGFELEDTGWFGWVTGWPATSGAGRKAISQMHHWPDNAELAGLRRGLHRQSRLPQR